MPTARNFTATQPFGASTNVGSLYYLMSMGGPTMCDWCGDVIPVWRISPWLVRV